MARELGDKFNMAAILNTLGYISLEEGKNREAHSFFTEGLHLAQGMGYWYIAPVLWQG